MTDYSAYRSHVGITNPEMVKAVQDDYSAFNKIAASFVNHSNTFGVCLLPEAEKSLVDRYGPGPGLASIPFSAPAEEQEKPLRKRQDKRRKRNRITFRMDDELWSKALELKDAAGVFTMQELFEIILKQAIRDWEADENDSD